MPPPDAITRESILRLKFYNKPIGTIDWKTIAKKTESYSGADIDAIIDIAIEKKLEDSFADGIPKMIESNDLINAMKRHKPSTQEWFSLRKTSQCLQMTLRLYDDILHL